MRRISSFAPLALACTLACAGALPLAGCGFHLRGSSGYTLPFSKVFMSIPENSPLGIELSRNLLAGGQVELIKQRDQAQAVIEVLSESRDKQILSLNFQGRVREYTLTYSLRFAVKDGQGRELLAPNDIALKRTISFNESQVLAKEAEESLLYRDMQSDLVQQIIRRLASIKPGQ